MALLQILFRIFMIQNFSSHSPQRMSQCSFKDVCQNLQWDSINITPNQMWNFVEMFYEYNDNVLCILIKINHVISVTKSFHSSEVLSEH